MFALFSGFPVIDCLIRMYVGFKFFFIKPEVWKSPKFRFLGSLSFHIFLNRKPVYVVFQVNFD